MEQTPNIITLKNDNTHLFHCAGWTDTFPGFMKITYPKERNKGCLNGTELLQPDGGEKND